MKFTWGEANTAASFYHYTIVPFVNFQSGSFFLTYKNIYFKECLSWLNQGWKKVMMLKILNIKKGFCCVFQNVKASYIQKNFLISSAFSLDKKSSKGITLLSFT